MQVLLLASPAAAVLVTCLVVAGLATMGALHTAATAATLEFVEPLGMVEMCEGFEHGRHVLKHACVF
jgi:hypothetical protein